MKTLEIVMCLFIGAFIANTIHDAITLPELTRTDHIQQEVAR